MLFLHLFKRYLSLNLRSPSLTPFPTYLSSISVDLIITLHHIFLDFLIAQFSSVICQSSIFDWIFRRSFFNINKIFIYIILHKSDIYPLISWDINHNSHYIEDFLPHINICYDKILYGYFRAGKLNSFKWAERPQKNLLA